MSIRSNVIVAVARLAFGSASMIVTAGNAGTVEDSPAHDARESFRKVDAAEQFVGLAGQAPIGHRQPRAIGVPEYTELSPFELEQRRLNEELDRKLIICRGC